MMEEQRQACIVRQAMVKTMVEKNKNFSFADIYAGATILSEFCIKGNSTEIKEKMKLLDEHLKMKYSTEVV